MAKGGGMLMTRGGRGCDECHVPELVSRQLRAKKHHTNTAITNKKLCIISI